MKENMSSNIYHNSNYIKPRLNNTKLTKEDLKVFSEYINGGE